MKKLFACIFTFVLYSSCLEKNTEWSSERNATIFFNPKPKNEKFNLTFNKTDKYLSYKYISQIDTTKTISIKKITESDSLLFGFEKFIKTSKEPYKNKKLNYLEFDFYDLANPLTDGTGPILFNSKYGLLAVNNIFGPTIIFLDEKNNTLIEQIIDKLNN